MWHTLHMAKDALANHLRAWREFRQLTQDELGARIGTTGSVISLLENGHRQLSLKWLYKLAPALNTTPGMIVDHDPKELDTTTFELFADVPEASREQARAAVEGVINSFRQKRAS